MKALAIVLGVTFLAIAPMYWFGNIQFATSHPGPHHSHAILFLVLSAICFIWLRFQMSANSRTP